MSKITNQLLKDAIADAEAVRQTAIENAKLSLEETFTPQIKTMLERKLRAEAEGMESDEEEKKEGPEHEKAEGPEHEKKEAPKAEPIEDCLDRLERANNMEDLELFYRQAINACPSHKSKIIAATNKRKAAIK